MKKFQNCRRILICVAENSEGKFSKLTRDNPASSPASRRSNYYNMPAFQWNGMLVWYAAFKKHIGFYPRALAIAAFKDELTGYKTSKGAIQFPMEKAIPAGLVKKIVKFRVKENEQESKETGEPRQHPPSAKFRP